MRWRLLVELPEGPRRFELTEGEHTVGADSRCAIHLPEATVSRRHARLRVRSDALQVEDVGSRNGTWLGRSRLDAPAELQAGSALIFGTVPARVEAVAEEDAKAALLFEISGSIPAVVEEGRVETAGVSLLEVFVLDRLPRLLEGLYPRDSKALAKILDEHLHQLVPPVWSETREPAARGIFEIGDRRLRLRPGADPRLAEPLLETMAALWRLHEGLERSLYRVRPRLPDPPALPAPATRDPAVQRLYADAARVARGEVSVVILGETGSGKEVMAQWLHEASPRRDGPFLALNCAALPAELLEAELFGVEKGVATGVDARPGKLELAAGGTLFLDEVGDAPPALQAKLLRVLQERTLYRLGARQPTAIDVRVIAATHRDLERQVASGDLRLDLYHRLADWTASVPPLRSRSADIPPLAGHFLRAASKRLQRPVRGISQGALDAMLSYAWPGNVRELKQEMDRAALLLGPGELLDRPRLSPQIQEARGRPPQRRLEAALRDTERRHIARTLGACGGDRPAAAARLGISTATLYRRLKALELR